MIAPNVLYAQVLSSKGRFSVEFEKGCTPMTVNITELDSFGSINRQYFYFEGADITNSRTFTYSEAGAYQIIQVIDAGGVSDRFDTLFVEAVDAQRPIYEIIKCSNQEISVISSDIFYDSIRVYFTDSDSATLEFNEAAQFTFTNSSSQVIGFKGLFNNADEICDSYFEEILPSASVTAPSINNAYIKETCRDIYTLYINIDSFDTLVNYRISLEQSSNSRIFEGTITSNSFTIHDIPFSVDDYCITIETFDPCNNTSDFSNQYCQELTSLSLSPFESLYSSYTNSGIYINFDSVGSGIFSVSRRITGFDFEFRSEETGSFTDPSGSASRPYEYRIDYIDSCGQTLYSAETHPPLISAELLETNAYAISYTPPLNSLIEGFDSEYTVGIGTNTIVEPITSENFDIQLEAVNGYPRQLISASANYDNGLSVASNELTLRYVLRIYVPNAFTPDGDGLNDTLELFGLPSETATIKIYTRWGQLIYSSNEPSPGWDGTYGGRQAPQGTYLYEIIFETSEGDKLSQKGTFALIKK